MKSDIITVVKNKLDEINSFFAILAGYVVLIMNFIVLYAVIKRYIFNQPPVWTTETSAYMLMFITFIPLGFVLREDMHIRVDLIATRLGKKARKRLKVINAFMGAGFAAVLFWQSCRMVLTAFSLEWLTLEMAIPMGYPLLMMPLGSGILFLTLIVKGLFEVLSKNEQKGV